MADGTPFSRGYTWTKSVLQLRGLVSKGPKRSVHRKKRARRPLPGMLVVQDGSRHAGLPQGPPVQLGVTLDEATRARPPAALGPDKVTPRSRRPTGVARSVLEHQHARQGPARPLL